MKFNTIYTFKTLLIQENRCVLFECTYEPTNDKWHKFPRNGYTRKPYHNDTDLNSYEVCASSARRYYKGLVGVGTGQLSNCLWLYCLDFDHQRKPNGEWSDSVKQSARYFDSYTEQSVSGSGSHIFVLCERPYREDVGKIDHKWGEVYWSGQSIAMTGDLVSFDDWKSPVTVRLIETDKLFAWIDKFKTSTPPQITNKPTTKVIPQQVFTESDDTVLDHLYSEKDGERIHELFEVGKGSFGSRSRAIGYLACKLAFHSGHNVPQMIRLLKLSAVWNSYQPRRSDNWLKGTCENACCLVSSTRKPKLGTKEQQLYQSFRKERTTNGELK